MNLLVDLHDAPLPAWYGEMLAETPPATVGDFCAKYAAELVKAGKWPVDVSPNVAQELRTAVVVDIRTRPAASESSRAANAAQASLGGGRELHRLAAEAMRGDNAATTADRLEEVFDYWERLMKAMDALETMGNLPSSVKPELIELHLHRLESAGGIGEDAARCVEDLGFLSEQWAQDMKAKPS